jgi:plastocyanin
MRATPRTLILLAIAVVALVSSPLAATANAPTDTQVVSGPTAKYYGFLTPVVVIQKGGSITYTNVDLERHNVVQDVNADGAHGSAKAKWCGLFPKGRCPIFYSALIGLGQSEPVQGLSAVKPGQVYTFYCTLHPGMKGHLVVAPGGASASSAR